MPLTNQQLVDTFKQSASTLSGPQITQFLIGNGEYSNVGQITAQLQRTGLSKAQAIAAVTAKGPSELMRILQAASGFLWVPPGVKQGLGAAGGEAAAGGAAGGAATGAASGASSALAKALGATTLTALLTTKGGLLRVVEVIGGLILLVMGLRTLSGNTTTPISVTTGAARTAAKVAR